MQWDVLSDQNLSGPPRASEPSQSLRRASAEPPKPPASYLAFKAQGLFPEPPSSGLPTPKLSPKHKPRHTACHKQVQLFKIGGMQSGQHLKQIKGLEHPPTRSGQVQLPDPNQAASSHTLHPPAINRWRPPIRAPAEKLEASSNQIGAGQARQVQRTNKKTEARSEFERTRKGPGKCGAPAGGGLLQVRVRAWVPAHPPHCDTPNPKP